MSSSSAFNKIYYFFIGIIMSICLALDIPMRAIGRPLSLAGYHLVWSDEFDGDSLDTSKWSVRVHADGSPVQEYSDGFYTDRCVEVKDGNLILSIKKFDGSEEGYPAGWYYASINSMPGFFDSYGYFECRAKLAKAVAGNCAFWLNSPVAYDTSVPLEEGNEIDIMESMRYGVAHEGSIENNIHYFDSTGHQRLHARWVIVGGNPYEEYNTYGLKWDKTGYTFYVNGKECRQTDFGLASGPEYIVLSNAMRNFKTQSIVGDSADFIVDYVRVYQK
ncbi:MAG: glycoside hydrolase family 16 protein [Clostridia bacterium]|nr:glycoside hydrolase family 16 protein [Clostridia bacterium]MBR0510347.1 glycoside hydrolase family 16 protein [Clostridia bacterium]MBR0537249.1 glycoside hydrolase family 16 protein [Clostridia bacterium]